MGKNDKLQVSVRDGVTIKETKHSIVLKNGNGKRAAVIGKRVFLSNHLAKLTSFKELTKDEAVKKHLGVTRSIGKVEDAADLDRVLKIYFK